MYIIGQRCIGHDVGILMFTTDFLLPKQSPTGQSCPANTALSLLCSSLPMPIKSPPLVSSRALSRTGFWREVFQTDVNSTSLSMHKAAKLASPMSCLVALSVR